MRSAIGRPEAPSSGHGVLVTGEHFQCAYVTNDLDRACEALKGRFGLKQFSYLEGDLDGGGSIRVAFAWGGGTMYEIIDARRPAAGFYNGLLPGSGFAVRFHHLGYLLRDDAGWDAMKRTFADEVVDHLEETLISVERLGGLVVVAPHENPDYGVKAAIARDPAGHLIEIVQILPKM